jgi:hypothetical protein
MANINWLAVLIGGVAYFFLGYVWYTFLFGRTWGRALGMNPDAAKKEDMQHDMMKKLPWSFLGNLVAAAFVALLVSYAQANGDGMRAAKVGAVAGLGIAGSTLFMHYNWLGKSKTAWAIDIGYAMIGCGLAGWIIGAM